MTFQSAALLQLKAPIPLQLAVSIWPQVSCRLNVCGNHNLCTVDLGTTALGGPQNVAIVPRRTHGSLSEGQPSFVGRRAEIISHVLKTTGLRTHSTQPCCSANRWSCRNDRQSFRPDGRKISNCWSNRRWIIPIVFRLRSEGHRQSESWRGPSDNRLPQMRPYQSPKLAGSRRRLIPASSRRTAQPTLPCDGMNRNCMSNFRPASMNASADI